MFAIRLAAKLKGGADKAARRQVLLIISLQVVME